jgi:transposase-like protein
VAKVRRDKYQLWQSENIHESKLRLIKELASKGCGMNIIATQLDMCENTLYALRKKHKPVDLALTSGKDELEKNLLTKMYERAMGFTITDEDIFLEQTPTGTQKKVVKKLRHILADSAVLRYLLIIHFGKKYSEKKYELELSEKKQQDKENDNDWSPLNASPND